ncbi:cupin domain-containing protein [Companilactobacillus sp. HBUAS56275]|uniref:Cupin domain-containing protein n=1 Tax=Candidatus Companilactobacillus pullicola TaxID=2838523 RepID=A0A9D1ZPQ6_9LACO|nr:cupin domain-containing protein [Candidatus Companilactobacillus pullicola]
MNITEPKSQFGLGQKITNNPYYNGTIWTHEIPNFEYPMIASSITFSPGVRNNWHSQPSARILMVTDGEGWYQEQGKAAKHLTVGDIVKVPAGVKYWHGATKDSYFTHLILEDWSNSKPIWSDPVSDAEYNLLS